MLGKGSTFITMLTDLAVKANKFNNCVKIGIKEDNVFFFKCRLVDVHMNGCVQIYTFVDGYR